MRHIVSAPSDGSLGGDIDQFDDQRSVDRDGRVQAVRGLPGAKTHATHQITVGARGLKGQTPAVARQGITLTHQALRAHLEALDGGIDVPRCASPARLLSQNVPRLDGLAKLNIDALVTHFTAGRKAKLPLRSKPRRIQRITRGAQVLEDRSKILLDKVREKEAVV
jgi:hypothetical protein